MRISAIKKPSGLGSEEAPSLPQVPPGRSCFNSTRRNHSHSPSAAVLTHLCGQGKPCSVENVREVRGIMQCVSLGQPLCRREACSECLNPSPCGPEPRGSHMQKDVIPDEVSTPSPPTKGVVSSPSYPLEITYYFE